MNTIPLTFNDRQIDRTVIGGTNINKDYLMDIAVVILNNNGNHLRLQTLDNLITCGFRDIISTEPEPSNFNLEDISHRYESVKFLTPLRNCSDGELINACMAETEAEYVLVLRDSLHIPSGVLLQNLASRLTESKDYCIVPQLLDSKGQRICVNIMPEARKGRFLITPTEYIVDGVKALYPFNYVGLYNRKKFIELGGYDYTIKSSYWQNADLSLRAWLWGEKIKVSTAFMLQYENEYPIEDSTRNLSYLKFYLKNIMSQYSDDHAQIKLMSFLRFYFHSSCGLMEAFSQFKEAKKWVYKNRFRFKMDVASLIENWS